jgi:MoxR-like ATPase
MNVLLLGEPGTGKTRGLLAAFPDAIVVNVTGDTEVSDLIGSYVPSGPDTFVWVDGPIVRGMEEGRMVILDEIGLADSKVLALVYPLMDKKGDARKLMITANPARGTIVANDGFGISGTTNPNAKGVHLAEPLLSRCGIIMEYTTDYKVARELGCNERMVQAAEHLSKQRENGEIGWAPEMRELLDAKRIEEKFGLIMALRTLIMHCPEMEREVVETQLRERFGDVPGAARKVKGLKV